MFKADHAERLLLCESDCTASLGYCKRLQCLQNPVKTDRFGSLQYFQVAGINHTRGIQVHSVGSHVFETVMSPIVPAVQGFGFSVWFFQ